MAYKPKTILEIGNSVVINGTNGFILYNNNGVLGHLSTSSITSLGTLTSLTVSGNITNSVLTASKVVFTDASKNLTTTGIGTSAQFIMADGSLNSNTYLTANQTITLSGDASGSGTTSINVSISNETVTGKLLTGLSITGGTVVSTDSILQAIGKLQNQYNSVAGAMDYQGTWNASTNSPSLSSSTGTKGYVYRVTVSGSTNLDGITDWKSGDFAVFNGSTWDKWDSTDAVTSVNGYVGVVSLVSGDITESSNLYFTNARVDTRVESYTGDVRLSSGVFSIGSNKVTNAMLSTVATATFKGRVTASTGNVEDLTGTQATTLLDTFTSSLKGLAPASGGGTTNFLRADGTWAAPSGGGGSYTFSTGLTDSASTITVNLSTGVSGGQSVIGGTASGDNLTLSSTSNATKGSIIIGTSAYDELNRRFGLFTTTPTHKVEVVAGTLADGQNALNVTATMPTTITALSRAVYINITSAGSSSFTNRGLDVNYAAGYTGSSATSCFNGLNSAAGTATISTIISTGNFGISANANGTTTGTNIGSRGTASNGDINIGNFGYVETAKNSATNIGVAGLGLNTGTTPIQIGGFFGLMNTKPTFTSAALMCDNGSTTDDILNCRDNGTTFLKLADGGFLGLGNGNTAATSQLQVNKNQNSVTQADANGILLANSTAAVAGTQSISPAIVWQGNGWKTNATAASQEVRWRADVLPVQAGAAPTATWQLAYSINGGAYTNGLTVNSANGVTSVGQFTANTTSTFTGTATFNGDLTKGSFTASGNNISSSQHLLLGVQDTNIQQYRLTNGGSNVTAKFYAYSSASVAGTKGIIIDPTNSNGIVLSVANGTRHIAGVSINITNITSTAGSEAADMIFSTQNSGAGLTQHMRISKSGNIVLGNETALSTSATDGFVYMPSGSGAPSGTPNSYNGKKAFYYDETNDRIYVYNGSWKYTQLA